MKSFLEYLDTKFSHEDTYMYPLVKIAQLSYAVQYTIGILLAYALRHAGITTIYETWELWPMVMFISAYFYMQTDKIQGIVIPPIKLYWPLRILAFALMLTTLSQTAFNIIVFAMAATFIYVMAVVSNCTKLVVVVYTLTPTLMAHAIYCGVLLHNGEGFGFDIIAGWFILTSIAFKLSLMAIVERVITRKIMGDENVNINIVFDGKESTHPISYGYQLGKVCFLVNMQEIIAFLYSLAERLDEEE